MPAAANKIRNDLINLASPVNKENAKELADLGLGVDQIDGKKRKFDQKRVVFSKEA